MDATDSPQAGPLQTAVEEVVIKWDGVTTERLFGFPAYRVGGRLFAVLDEDGVALTRLRDADRERLQTDFEVGSFEAYGQTIGKWEYVPTDVDDLERLVDYVRASYATARSETRSVPPPDDE